MRVRSVMRFLALSALVATCGLGLPHDATASNWCADGVCEEWVARFDGGYNFASDLAVDGSGNVYVTGTSGTIKYDPDGGEQWVARGSGIAIAVDGSGNVHVTGGSRDWGTGFDYATAKYDSNGNQQWIARYDGPASGDDHPGDLDLAVDASGNVHVTGWSEGSGTGRDYATIKYDSDGNQQWVARYDGPASQDDTAVGIALDGSGNVYVTGRSEGLSTGLDYATAKYDSDGNQQWIARYDGFFSEDDAAVAITLDGSGNVYVTGHSPGPGTGEDYATVKYDSNGNQQWMARYDGPASGNEYARDLVIDGLGNAYVTGISYESVTDDDYATIKYGPEGSMQWVARYGYSYHDGAHALAVDGWGNVYVTGSVQGSWVVNYSTNYATLKYTTDGYLYWRIGYGGVVLKGWDDPGALAVDGSGNVYVTGSSSSQYDLGVDYATIKYAQISPTPTPTPTPTPPPGVGGTVKLPPAITASESAVPADGSDWSASAIALAAAAVGGVILLAAGDWYARRQRLG